MATLAAVVEVEWAMVVATVAVAALETFQAAVVLVDTLVMVVAVALEMVRRVETWEPAAVEVEEAEEAAGSLVVAAASDYLE